MAVVESGLKLTSSECSVLPGELQDYFTIFFRFTLWPKTIHVLSPFQKHIIFFYSFIISSGLETNVKLALLTVTGPRLNEHMC